MLEFRVLDLERATDRTLALAVWEATIHRDPHAHPAYVALFSRLSGARPLCAVGTWPGGSVMMPLALRNVPGGEGSGDLDAITPYGYGGAYVSRQVNEDEFWSHWRDWAEDRGLIGLVIRRNVNPKVILGPSGTTAHVMDNVVIDISQGPDNIWHGFEGRVRTDCRRAEHDRVRVVLDDTGEHIEEFHRMYIDTMTARGAAPFYLFSLDDLTSLQTELSKSTWLSCAYIGDRMIASEMYLVGAEQAYYFLAGSSAKARDARAHHALKWQTSGWLHTHGVKRLVLGGGMRAGDSLFQHKRSFAPKGVVPFVVEHQEFRADRSASLIAARRAVEPDWDPDPTYYPAYRAPSR